MWKQRCELLFTGPMVKIENEIHVQCKDLLYWSGEHGMELFNNWNLSADDQTNVYKRDQLNAPGGRRKPQSNNNQLGKTQRCRNWDWGPEACDQCPAKKWTCHYCQDLAKVCLSNLRKKSVHEIEASSSNNASTNPELTQQLSDWVFLPAKQNSWWLRAES